MNLRIAALAIGALTLGTGCHHGHHRRNHGGYSQAPAYDQGGYSRDRDRRDQRYDRDDHYDCQHHDGCGHRYEGGIWVQIGP